ncbi:MAG TPA: T9SS type A sorting domain-containing protein [Bacteroidales bacterium]|nr:T9SS type A sorting domain-containing protein [Bacteroidales bacterium]
MKDLSISVTLMLFLINHMYAQTTYEIKAQGLDFIPSGLTVLVGDKVVFNAGTTHPVLEVNKATWDANGSAALADGFDFPGGSGEIVFQSPGTRYYICTSHISSGMKGTIQVNQVTSLEDIGVRNKRLTVFPNPVTGSYMQIIYDAEKEIKSTIRLINLNGKPVKEITGFHFIRGKNDFTIETADIKPGFYFIEMTGTDLQLHTRILKM